MWLVNSYYVDGKRIDTQVRLPRLQTGAPMHRTKERDMPTMKDRGLTPKEAAMRYLLLTISCGHKAREDIQQHLGVTLTARQHDSICFHIDQQMAATRKRIEKWIDKRNFTPAELARKEA